MASAVASLALGASALSPTLRSVSNQADMLVFSASPHENERAATTSTSPPLIAPSGQSSNQTEPMNIYSMNNNTSGLDISPSDTSISNPGLSALASAASAPTSYLRFVLSNLRGSDGPRFNSLAVPVEAPVKRLD